MGTGKVSDLLLSRRPHGTLVLDIQLCVAVAPSSRCFTIAGGKPHEAGQSRPTFDVGFIDDILDEDSDTSESEGPDS